MHEVFHTPTLPGPGNVDDKINRLTNGAPGNRRCDFRGQVFKA
jgi:hypothetical protein